MILDETTVQTTARLTVEFPSVLVPEAAPISNLENPPFVTDALLKWLEKGK